MCVEIDSDLGGCALVWACLSLTPTVLSGRVCYLSGRRSWLLADIWISVEVSRCDSWINTGKAPCPTLTFAWAGRVRRPNAMLLSRYYLYHLLRTQGDRHEGSRALLFTFLIEILYVRGCVYTGPSGVANRPGRQPSGQLPLHPGQQHRLTGRGGFLTHTRQWLTSCSKVFSGDGGIIAEKESVIKYFMQTAVLSL